MKTPFTTQIKTLILAILSAIFAANSLKADIRPVSAPLSLTAECRAGYNIVSWSVLQDKEHQSGYRVYRSLSSGGPYTVLCTVKNGSENHCQDNEIANGVRYYYLAKAIDLTGREGLMSNEASVIADTVPPSAHITPPLHMKHFSRIGPNLIQGKTTDAISGVAEVRVALRRNDTMEWWAGSEWKKSSVPIFRKASIEKNGIFRWNLATDDVIWSQATAYYIRIAATDNAGFIQDPSDSATIFVGAPAELSISIASAPASVVVGQVVNVSVLVANTGGTEANSIRIYPLKTSGNGQALVIGHGQQAMVPVLGPGEYSTVSWSYSPTSPGTLVFSTTAYGSDSLNGSLINSSPAPSNPVSVRKAANLDVSISQLPANIRQGAPLLIRMFVTNAGESDALVTSLVLASSKPGALGVISGPEPAMPQMIRAGQTREFLWRAKAALSGGIRLSGRASGYDESSGLFTNSGQQPAVAVGFASAPGSVNLSSSTDSVIVKSTVGLVAEVKDKDGTPVPGVAVSFQVISGKGKVKPDIAVTDELGRAQADLVTGASVGINAVEARVGAVLSAVSIEGVAPGGIGQGLSRNIFDPSKEPLEIKLNLENAGKINVTIRTLAGENVKQLIDRKVSAGISVLTWDGRDAQGGIVPDGLYYILIQSENGTSSRRVSVLTR